MRKPDDPIDCTEPASTPAGAPGAVPEGDAESVYGRWSRRKARARGARQPQPPAVRDDARTPASAPVSAEPDAGDPVHEGPPARILTDDDMPALELLGEDDDYSAFLSPGVSEPLRRQALRKLFASSRFNVLSELDDYAEDYTSFEPLGSIVTADMRHRIEMEAERARRAVTQQARESLAQDAPPAAAADTPAHQSVQALEHEEAHGGADAGCGQAARSGPAVGAAPGAPGTDLAAAHTDTGTPARGVRDDG